MFIEIRGVHKTYATRAGGSVNALADVSLSIEEGEFVSAVGPSGCGKTTLLKILAGLLAPTRGEITVAGQPLHQYSKAFGVVFQSPVLLPWLTVLDNVLVPAKVLGLDMARSKRRAADLLELVSLKDFANKYPQELSGGMQQRVSIARSLVHEPQVLLMDEPFGALDAMTRELMNQELLRIWQTERKTVLFITHSIPESVFLADRVLVMSPRPGRVLEVVEPGFRRPRDLELMGEPAFGACTTRIRQLLNARQLVGV